MQASESNSQRSRLKRDSDRPSATPPVVGLLVADSSLRPLLTNLEAITILTYPGPPSQSLINVLRKKVGPTLVNNHNSPNAQNGTHGLMELKSGRRTYFWRAFVLNSIGKDRNDTATLLVLERGMPPPVALSEVYGQFNFTHREQQSVNLLLQGLSGKEMAEHMGISANTVKTFLRMAAVKMGVSSRFGIVAKILGLLLPSRPSVLVNGTSHGNWPTANLGGRA